MTEKAVISKSIEQEAVFIFEDRLLFLDIVFEQHSNIVTQYVFNKEWL